MRVRHREDNSPSTYHGNGVCTSPGDVVDVEDSVGESLLERRWYDRVDEDADTEDADTEDAEELDNAFDEFDEEEWLDLDYREREQRVREGDVDDVLPLIAGIETSGNVKDAVDERAEDLGDDVIELESVDDEED